MNSYQLCVLLVLVGILLVGCVPANAGWKQDRFMITVWCNPPAEEGPLTDYRDEGYTLAWVPAERLDMAQKLGLQGMLRDPLLETPATLDTAEGRAQLDALIEKVKNHPAMEAYYLVDEPGVSAFEGWGKMVAYLKERDPKHLAYINLYPTYASKEQLNLSADEIRKISTTGDQIFTALAGEQGSVDVALAYKQYLQRFVDVVKPELISYDHYHFFGWGDGAQYFLNLELIRSAALTAKLPFLNIIQADRFDQGWRRPNANEMRFLVYTTMAYGGRGISYFTYWGPESYHGLYEDGKRTPYALDAAVLNKEMAILGPELMKLTSTEVYHTGDIAFGARAIPADCPIQVSSKSPSLLGLFTENTGTDAFMIMNRDYKNLSSVKLTFAKGITGLREFNRKTKKWQTYVKLTDGGPAVVLLQPADGRLFKLVK